MNATKKRYDGKHRVTRIFLADYQLLKRLSQQAGMSMAETLHKLITGGFAHKVPVTPVKLPVPAARAMPVPTAITTNGNKVVAFRIKTKGVRYA
ncbi:unnamed protein product [marine sediment metagenome]|uniref:Uncharacterized protein n=1 Tax=marine sediment metagenome TaxID=412755 RepID=X1SJD5_9ZZZZ